MAPKNFLPIDDQGTSPYAGLAWGKKGTVGKDGSGAVAFFNLLAGIGEDQSFPLIVRMLKFYHAPARGGLGGTRFWLLPTVLRAAFRDVKARYHPGKSLQKVDSDGVIVGYRQKGLGRHYVAGIRVGPRSYVFYNDGCSGRPMTLPEYAESAKRQEKKIFLLITVREFIGS